MFIYTRKPNVLSVPVLHGELAEIFPTIFEGITSPSDNTTGDVGFYVDLLFNTELTTEEEQILQDIVNTHRGFQPLYIASEYEKGILQKISRYAKSDGAGNLSMLFDETTYLYDKKKLTGYTVVTFDPSGTASDPVTRNYYIEKQGNKDIIIEEVII